MGERYPPARMRLSTKLIPLDSSKRYREGSVFGGAGEGELGSFLLGMGWHVI